MEDEANEARGGIKNTIWEILKFALIVVVIVVPVRFWIAQPFIVSGSSMEPTFSNGDYLIIDELSYDFRQPRKGDVIVFRFPRDPSKFFIKRIAGLPGEEVVINGQEWQLGENEYFVLGDNRRLSSDSRVWGPLEKKLITGRALLRLWPPQKLDYLPGQ
jgi:signal peptidase I